VEPYNKERSEKAIRELREGFKKSREMDALLAESAKEMMKIPGYDKLLEKMKKLFYDRIENRRL
jgi:hypothetical protein